MYFNGGLSAVEVREWMNNHILLFYMDVITYSCHLPGAALAKTFVSKRDTRKFLVRLKG